MGSLTFGGHDFGALAACEVVSDVCVPCGAESFAVPGAAGRLLVSSEPGVRVIRVRLRMLGAACCHGLGFDEAAALSASWLAVEGGCELRFGGSEELFYREAVCTSCEPWRLVDGVRTCVVEFTCFDPVRYGREVSVSSSPFAVGGSWRTWPVVDVAVSAACEGIVVADGRSGRKVIVHRELSAGQHVVVDCERCAVEVGGVDCAADVDPRSDFFCLEPGDAGIALTNCTLSSITYRECWM